MAVTGVAAVDGVGLGAAATTFCAMTMLAPKSSAVAAIKTFFIGIVLEKLSFEIEWFDCLTNP